MQIRISFRSRSDLILDADHALDYLSISWNRRASRFVAFRTKVEHLCFCLVRTEMLLIHIYLYAVRFGSALGNGQLSPIFGVPNYCALLLLVLCLFKVQVETKKRKNEGHQKLGTVGRSIAKIQKAEPGVGDFAYFFCVFISVPALQDRELNSTLHPGEDEDQ